VAPTGGIQDTNRLVAAERLRPADSPAVTEVVTGPRPDTPGVRRRRIHRPARSGRLALTPNRLAPHASRFAIFSAIGAAVFLVGLGMQVELTGRWHVSPVISYMIQAVTSVEASFQLNRWLTWRGRKTPFWRALWRFNAQKAVTILLNLALYAGLLRLGMNYLLANITLTAAFTLVNYLAGDRFVFVPGDARQAELAEAAAEAVPSRTRGRLVPAISVVIPCRDNETTIREAVQSLLDQDYPGLQEIILIGSPGDSTWNSVADIADPRLVLREEEAPPGIRDANFKRDVGIRMSAGELIALVDSDVVLPRHWMSRAVEELQRSGLSYVTGGMMSVHDSFWGRFTDTTLIGAKTPRIVESYTVTSANFGMHGQKPPITASALFTRELYERCPIDSAWSHGSYEDYEWCWRVTRAGYGVRVCRDLFCWHHHRHGLRALAHEYQRSSRGCAYFIRAHLDSPLARRRLGQAVILPLAAAAAAVGVVITAAAHGYIPDLGALALICAAALCGYQIMRTRRLESAAYPAVGLALGAVFTMGLVTNLIRSGGSVLTSAPAASTVQAPADTTDALSVADPQAPPVAASRLPNRRR
jgi:GT2 family glycosyltransferase/putative flippase GtrA